MPATARKAKPRPATTVRLAPHVKERLAKLGEVLNQPINGLVNQAVAEFVERRFLEVEKELEATLSELRAYRSRDPDFEDAIAAVAAAEVTAGEDPAEGRVLTRAGPTEQAVLDRLDE